MNPATMSSTPARRASMATTRRLRSTRSARAPAGNDTSSMAACRPRRRRRSAEDGWSGSRPAGAGRPEPCRHRMTRSRWRRAIAKTGNSVRASTSGDRRVRDPSVWPTERGCYSQELPSCLLIRHLLPNCEKRRKKPQVGVPLPRTFRRSGTHKGHCGAIADSGRNHAVGGNAQTIGQRSSCNVVAQRRCV